MSSDWMDELFGDSVSLDEDGDGGFFCPYTSGPECALTAKGWQPQELCSAIECEQLKFFHRSRRRNEAA